MQQRAILGMQKVIGEGNLSRIEVPASWGLMEIATTRKAEKKGNMARGGIKSQLIELCHPTMTRPEVIYLALESVYIWKAGTKYSPILF
jgi:hypothetical protein